MATMDELVAAIGDRYARSGRVDKDRILDEFVAVAGIHRCSPVRRRIYRVRLAAIKCRDTPVLTCQRWQFSVRLSPATPSRKVSVFG